MPKVRSQPPTTKSSTFYLVQLFSWPTISISIGCPDSIFNEFFIFKCKITLRVPSFKLAKSLMLIVSFLLISKIVIYRLELIDLSSSLKISNMVNLHLLISSSFDIIHTLHSSYLCKPVRALFKTIVCHITIPAYTYVLMLEPTKRQILTFVKV